MSEVAAAEEKKEKALPTESENKDAKGATRQNNNEQSKISGADVWKAAKTVLTPERIIGVIAILLLPCFLTPWVKITALEKIGMTTEMSMPDALSISTSAVSTMQDIGDFATEAKKVLDKGVDALEKGTEVLALTTDLLNGDEKTYKQKVTDLANSLINETIDDAQPTSSVAGTIASEAAEQVIDQGVDEAAAAIEGTELQENLEIAGEKAAAANVTAQEVQSTAKEIQSTATELKAQYDSTLATAKTALAIAKIAWYGFLLLLLVAGVLLIIGIKGRYVTGIVAFSFSTVASLGTLIGISIANQAVLDAITGTIGAWVLAFVPSVIITTGWPWAVAIISIAGIVGLGVLLKKRKNEKNAATNATTDEDREMETAESVE